MNIDGRVDPIMKTSNEEDMVYDHEVKYVLRERTPNKYAECSERNKSANFETVLQCQVVVNDFRWLWRAEELNLIQTSLDPNSEKSYEIKHKDVKAGTLIKMMWGQIEHYLEGKTEAEILKIVKGSYERLVL